jgi:TatD DNase family protein
MIDFHCHLDLYPDLYAVRDECVKRELYVLSVTTTPSAWKGTCALAGNAPRIRTGLGLHPQIAHERHSELPLFDAFLHETRYVGEIGLDGDPQFKMHWEKQTYVFEHILKKCSQVGGRVMSIHSKRASGPVLDCLERFTDAGTPILHWFSGNFKDLDRAIELGCWFSVGPAMLEGEKGRTIASRIPRDRILTESDGPFAQIKGVTVMPWEVEVAVKKLGELWSLSFEDARATVHQNLRVLSEKYGG